MESQCLRMKDNLVNAGKFINAATAIESLEQYFHEPGVPDRDDETHIYGHTFGLNKLREFLFKMDIYNAAKTNDDERLYGYRVYYGKCRRDDPDYPMEPADGLFRDVFFMPVLKDGRDLYTVAFATDPNLILASSRPCPNQCSTRLGFIGPEE